MPQPIFDGHPHYLSNTAWCPLIHLVICILVTLIDNSVVFNSSALSTMKLCLYKSFTETKENMRRKKKNTPTWHPAALLSLRGGFVGVPHDRFHLIGRQ